jgi:hypothetical protein
MAKSEKLITLPGSDNPAGLKGGGNQKAWCLIPFDLYLKQFLCQF